jgi:hypothetical protein
MFVMSWYHADGCFAVGIDLAAPRVLIFGTSEDSAEKLFRPVSARSHSHST